MPRITPIDYRTLLKVFQMFGCQYKRKEGSHHILVYPGAKRAVVIPEYDEIDTVWRSAWYSVKALSSSKENYFLLAGVL